MYTPIFLEYRTGKKTIGLTNESVISTSENNRVDFVKESKSIEKRLHRIRRSDLQN